jgi:hypothetical protein
MILPNKVVSFDESVLSLLPNLLQRGPAPISLASLYEEASAEFESVDQFLLTLDLLFILERISVDMESGVVSYVDSN